MVGELAALGAALAWAGGSLIIKPMTVRFGPLSLNTLSNAAAWPLLLVFLLLTGKIAEVALIPHQAVGYIIVSGFFGLVIGTTVYLKALSLASFAIVYPVAYSCWLLGAAAIAAAFLGESITWLTISGALIIILGLGLLTMPTPKSNKPTVTLTNTGGAKGIALAVVAGLCWAAAVTLIKLSLESTSAVMVNVIRLPAVVLLLGLFTLGQGKRRDFARYDLKTIARVGFAGCLDQALGAIFLFVSIQMAGAARATILSSTSPLFATVLAVIFLKEKVTARVLLGTLCCVLGIWLTML